MEAVGKLPDSRHVRVDLDVHFVGETIRSDLALARKLELLFPNVAFAKIKATRNGKFTSYYADLNADDFLIFIDETNIGAFSDYTIIPKGFTVIPSTEGSRFNFTFDEHFPQPIDIKKPDPTTHDLVLEMKKGPDQFDPPARGLIGFNLLGNQNKLIEILQHFGLKDRITMASRGSPSDPTLRICLKQELGEVADIINDRPLKIYEASEQSKAAFNNRDIWVHAMIDPGIRPKRVHIEGAGGRMSIKTLVHLLSYHGDITAPLEAETWADDGPLAGILTGSYSCMMRIKLNFGYIFDNYNAFKITYQGQPITCSTCYGLHRASHCDRKDESRRDLLHLHVQGWKRLVNFTDLDDNVTKTISDTPNAILEDYASKYGIAPGDDREHSAAEAITGPELDGDPANEDGEPAEPASMPGPTTSPSASMEKDASPTTEAIVPGDIDTVVTQDDEKSDATALGTGATDTTGTSDDEESDATAPSTIDRTPTTTATTSTTTAAATASTAPMTTTTTETTTTTITTTAGPVTAAAAAANATPTTTADKTVTILSDSPDDDSDLSTSTPKKSKRKAASPAEKSIKVTGSGQKKPQYADKERKLFRSELKSLQLEGSKKPMSKVGKEKMRRGIDIILEKYQAKLFRNPDGHDPGSEDCWRDMNLEADSARQLLN